jgi:D-alanyl-D-alanine carboxypeptidase
LHYNLESADRSCQTRFAKHERKTVAALFGSQHNSSFLSRLKLSDPVERYYPEIKTRPKEISFRRDLSLYRILPFTCRAGTLMKRTLVKTVLLCSLAVCATAADRPVRENPEVVSGIQMFEAWLTEQMAFRGLPGVAVAVVHDQELVWARGFGYADVERHVPVKTDTIFRMASNTKMFTAIALLQLRDQGKLHLDDPVSKHLPWFRIQPSGDDDPLVTIEQLLTHGSGLPREAAEPYWATFEFPTKEEVQQTIVSQRAAYPAEVRVKYSNLGFSLAGYIVEAVSGEPYTEYVTRHILKPLGMDSSSIEIPPDQMDRLARGYGRRMPDSSRRLMPFSNLKGIGPAGGLSSTVEDMARFVELQFRTGRATGAQILRGSTLREMQRIRFLENDWTRGNGLGFAVWRDRGKTFFGHGGSLAGYKTQTTIQSDDKVGVIVLTNGDDAVPQRIADRAMQWIGEVVAKVAAPTGMPLWDPSWRQAVGLYRSLGEDRQVLEFNSSLVVINPLLDDPQTSMMKLIPVAGGGFKLDAPSGSPAIGEPVIFGKGADGRINVMTIGKQPYERVTP